MREGGGRDRRGHDSLAMTDPAPRLPELPWRSVKVTVPEEPGVQVKVVGWSATTAKPLGGTLKALGPLVWADASATNAARAKLTNFMVVMDEEMISEWWWFVPDNISERLRDPNGNDCAAQIVNGAEYKIEQKDY